MRFVTEKGGFLTGEQAGVQEMTVSGHETGKGAQMLTSNTRAAAAVTLGALAARAQVLARAALRLEGEAAREGLRGLRRHAEALRSAPRRGAALPAQRVAGKAVARALGRSWVAQARARAALRALARVERQADRAMRRSERADVRALVRAAALTASQKSGMQDTARAWSEVEVVGAGA